MKNYAFIDGQNFYKGISRFGWKVDTKKFRIYLKDHYKINIAYLFVGEDKNNIKLRSYLINDGYQLIKKPVMHLNGVVKGNCDTDLVFYAMRTINDYDRAVLITSDGDYYRLIDHLKDNNKLLRILLPDVKYCSALIKSRAMQYITEIKHLRNHIEYIR